jgi:hypothetical protein
MSKATEGEFVLQKASRIFSVADQRLARNLVSDEYISNCDAKIDDERGTSNNIHAGTGGRNDGCEIQYPQRNHHAGTVNRLAIRISLLYSIHLSV